MEGGLADLPVRGVAELKDVDLRRRRGHALLRRPLLPRSALMNALLPALNSPTITRRKSSSSCSIDFSRAA